MRRPSALFRSFWNLSDDWRESPSARCRARSWPEGIERLWAVSQPLLDAPPPVRLYEPGSWGPKPVHPLMQTSMDAGAWPPARAFVKRIPGTCVKPCRETAPA